MAREESVAWLPVRIILRLSGLSQLESSSCAMINASNDYCTTVSLLYDRPTMIEMMDDLAKRRVVRSCPSRHALTI